MRAYAQSPGIAGTDRGHVTRLATRKYINPSLVGGQAAMPFFSSNTAALEIVYVLQSDACRPIDSAPRH